MANGRTRSRVEGESEWPTFVFDVGPFFVQETDMRESDLWEQARRLAEDVGYTYWFGGEAVTRCTVCGNRSEFCTCRDTSQFERCPKCMNLRPYCVCLGFDAEEPTKLSYPDAIDAEWWPVHEPAPPGTPMVGSG